MRPSQKSSRGRGKSNRNKSLGNVVNRVFESAGPEGKVRGTPQQIIDKYEQLARDAATAGDRVVAENFLQHAEHYARMLSSAQAEQQAQQQKREAEQQQAQQQQGGGGRREDEPRQEEQTSGGGRGQALETIDTREEDDSPLVSTPEAAPPEEGQGKPKPARRRRARRGADKGEGGDGQTSGDEGQGPQGAGDEANQPGSTEPVSG
jgi:hypothetical protein